MVARSVFDIIGPVMIGPSSSHTAGAVRIGRFARAALLDKPITARIILYGSFAKTYRGHGTDRALLGGLLNMSPADERIRDSFIIAEREGLRYEFISSDSDEKHPNTAGIYLTGNTGKKVFVEGCSIGGGEVFISRIDNYEVEIKVKRFTLLVEHENRPGVAGRVTTMLGDQNINISALRLSGNPVNRSCNLLEIECDQFVPEKVREKLCSMPAISKVIWVNP